MCRRTHCRGEPTPHGHHDRARSCEEPSAYSIGTLARATKRLNLPATSHPPGARPCAAAPLLPVRKYVSSPSETRTRYDGSYGRRTAQQRPSWRLALHRDRERRYRASRYPRPWVGSGKNIGSRHKPPGLAALKRGFRYVAERVIPDIVAPGLFGTVAITDEPAWLGLHAGNLRPETGIFVQSGTGAVMTVPERFPTPSGRGITPKLIGVGAADSGLDRRNRRRERRRARRRDQAGGQPRLGDSLPSSRCHHRATFESFALPCRTSIGRRYRRLRSCS